MIIKLRTRIWAVFSDCTLSFTRNFREGWTFICLISIMELILPRASEVIGRLRLPDTLLMQMDIWAELFPLGAGLRGVNDGPQVKLPSLARWQDLEGFLSLHTVRKFPKVPTLVAKTSHLSGVRTALEVVLTVPIFFFCPSNFVQCTSPNWKDK